MPVPVLPSDEPEQDERTQRDPAEIFREIIGNVSEPSNARSPLL